MTTHTFTLIVDGPDLQSDELIDDVYEAGCDDALIGRADGIQFADFDREADTFQYAVLTAVAELECIAGITVTRLADAGLVSMADIAARTGRTRESVRLLITGERGPGGFPPPVTDPRGRYRLWRSDEVETWLREHLAATLDNATDDHIRAAINACLELRHHRAHLDDTERSKLRTLVDI
ncbi:helix-turn-helix transcriptional regulator [Candidatus Poriferisodalis sp.]|uniref:helix-turn-helix transcriptional regulator n=1 Tax=Candidatus Poriferisodalis sp. TaxID=3101277 RepID=UPI003B5A1D01